jgi:hypothetical protein
VLPVASGTVGGRGAASLAQGGRVTLKVGAGRAARTLTLTGWKAGIANGTATLSAVTGRRRRALLVARVSSRTLTLDASTGSVRLRAVTLRLTRVGASLIRTRLALDELAAGTLGTLRVTASVPGRTTGGSGGGGGGTGKGTGGGGSGTGGGGTTTPPPGCTPGFASGPIEPAPAPLARPTGAFDISAATFAWRPKESFVQYVNTGEGTSVADGATAGPLEPVPGNSARLTYSFGFTLKPGSWYDPVSQTAGLLAQGTVRFRYSAHGIDISVKNPEVELNGRSSRAVFTFVGSDCSVITETRSVMLDLAPRAPGGTPPTFDYGQIPATITRSGASMFSGFYNPGDAWGSFGLAFTAGP